MKGHFGRGTTIEVLGAEGLVRLKKSSPVMSYTPWLDSFSSRKVFGLTGDSCFEMIQAI